jgi:hypothetical protein
VKHQNNVVATWQDWYHQNRSLFRYSPILIDEANTRDCYTFEPFLAWSNALTRVERIHLIATSSDGSRATRIMSQPDSGRKQAPLVYDRRKGVYRPTKQSKNNTLWVLVEKVREHK